MSRVMRPWVGRLVLAFGGLFWLANAHAFDLAIRDLNDEALIISSFTYLINEDNTANPFDPDPNKHPGVAPMASYSPIVAAGHQGTASGITLPPGRYLISVRAANYKLWGRHIRVDAAGAVFDTDGNNLGGIVTIALRPAPLPLAKLKVLVFEDFHEPNGFPDFPHEVDINHGGSVTNMAGFHIVLSDGTGQVVVDAFGNPICGTGTCLTDAGGNVTIPNLVHGKYEITAIPPSGSGWIQTTTFEGTKQIEAWLEEGSDGLGAPGELLLEPAVQTAHFSGFVHQTKRNTLGGGSGTITGTARNLVPFPPFEQLRFGEPVVSPWIVVTDLGTDTQVWVTRGDTNGTFTISNVPAGLYQLMIFDEFLHYINAFYTVKVADGQTVSPGFDPSCTTANVSCSVGLFRWFGWLSGYVFNDSNRNAIRDSGEIGIPNVEVRGAFRDGSHYKGTLTNSSGFYELPALKGPLGRMFNAEVGFTHFGVTGHSVHHEQYANFNQRDPNPTVVDPGVGGGLILSQAIWEGKRSIVDWGKVPYASTEPGLISGRVLYATTRNEYDARFQAAEDYEPGIPNVTLRLWGLGPDGLPNTPDDVLLNEVQSDAWQMPRLDNPDNPVACDVLNKDGLVLPGPTPAFIATNCIEVPALGNETKPGAYDGGWAFGSMCPPDPVTGASTVPCAPAAEISPIPPGTYVVQVVPPPFYQVVKEEDVNVAEGIALVPQLPPPPCVGALHTVPALPAFPNFPFTGQAMPLCDKRLVTMEAQQNPGLDIFLFTTDLPYVAPVPPSTERSSWTSAQAVPPPGRFFGIVEDDINLNLDPNSITYGEKRGVPGLPIGVYEFGGGVNAVGRRLLTVRTDENGFYEVLLPSTTVVNTPIPGGVSPAMYVLVVNDPGPDPRNPNPGFSKAYLTEPAVRDIWPGKMTAADTPVDPIGTLVCGVPPDAPQIFQVSTPVVAAGQATNLTIKGMRFGNTPAGPPTVTLDDDDGVADPVVLPVVAWTPAAPFQASPVFEDVVVVTVPASFPAGPAQLSVTSGPIIGAPGGVPGLTLTAGGKVSRNGLTIHVWGGTYTPPVVNVSPPATIQDAIDLAGPGSLIVVAPGTYHENVILHKMVKLQGYGPGGAVGAGNVEPTDFPCPEVFCPPVTLPGEEPFTHIPGTVIDGRFFHFVQGKRAAWAATLAASGPFSGPATVPAGAGITVVVQDGEFGPETGLPATAAAQIDGLGITTSRGEAGGGIYVHAFGRNLIISNNILESNQSTHGGAISLGQPIARGGLADHQNDNIRMHHNRMLDNGGVFFAGAVGIFSGADNYRFDHNDVCGGFSAEYGGGFSHWGRSPGANIYDNRFYYNDAVDEGGGLMIAGDPDPGAPLGRGSGEVTIERNLIQSNLSNDDGGGIRLLRPLNDRVNIVNNVIVNNVATDHGGGISLDDAANVVIVNNTIAGNVSTHTAEDSIRGQAHGAGITSELHSALFTNPQDGSRFSNPVMFNNIIFDNLAYRWALAPNEAGVLGLRLVPTAYIDLEVFGGGAGDCLTVSFSFLSGPRLGPTGAPCPPDPINDPTNIVADGGSPGDPTGPIAALPDPRFVFPMTGASVEILVTPGRFNPIELVPFLDRKEGTLVGHTDYHLQVGLNRSLAIDAGTAGPADDIDRDTRPQQAGVDMGADEATAPPAAGVLETELVEYFVAEGGTLIITVTRTGGSTGAVTVDYQTFNFTTAQAAKAGLDYVATSGTLSWADGDVTPRTIVITTLQDTIVEHPDNEEFFVVLSNPTGGAVLASGTSGVSFTPVVIVDNFTAAGQAVVSFTLMNADTGQDIGPLVNGMQLIWSALPTRNLNIRANTSPAVVGSVRFNLDGTANFRTDSLAPYWLAAGSPAWTPAAGSHTLTATPYQGQEAIGIAGTPLTVNFTVVNDTAFGGTVALSVDDASLRAGERLIVRGTFYNTGGPALVDAYLGVIMTPAFSAQFGCAPGVVPIAFITSTGAVVRCATDSPSTFPAFARNVPFPTINPPITVEVLNALIPPGIPPSTLTVFLALTLPNAFADGVVDVLATATATFSIVP